MIKELNYQTKILTNHVKNHINLVFNFINLLKKKLVLFQMINFNNNLNQLKLNNLINN